VSRNPETNSKLYEALLEQVFNLAYYAGMDPIYVTGLPTEDRLYYIKLLIDAKRAEAKIYKTGGAPKPSAIASRPANLHPRIKF